MIKVSFTNSVKYHGIVYKPYEQFLIDDCDKDEMIRSGATIIESKATNPNKVELKEEIPKDIPENVEEPFKEEATEEEKSYISKKKGKK